MANGEKEDLQAVDAAAQAPEEEPYPNEPYAWFVVGVLMIVYVFSFIDRQILALLVGPIRADLQISDTEMSYLMGFSFALFYTVFGIPMGRLADSTSRRGLIAAGLVVWSLMSAGCGIAKNYWQLLAFRVGVGVGEATLSPSAYSLLTDYFRPKRLALAISIYGAGIYIGSGLAFLLGGLVVDFASGQDSYSFAIIGDVRPWQLVFFAIGLPGVVFTLALLSVKEPVRRGVSKTKAASEPVSVVVGYLGKNWKTFICHTVGFAMLSFIGYGAAAWIPSFYVRVHGWEPGATGIRYGIAVIIFGTAGIIYGGHLAEKLRQRGYADSKIRAGFIASAIHLPVAVAFPLMPNGWAAYALMCPASFTLAMPFGVAAAAIQEVMPNRMRGQASSLYLFVVNLIGLGIGPSAVAWCTDYVFGDDNKVHLSLLLSGTIANTLSVLLLWFAMPHFVKSLGFKDGWEDARTELSQKGFVIMGIGSMLLGLAFLVTVMLPILVNRIGAYHPAVSIVLASLGAAFVIFGIVSYGRRNDTLPESS